jgi:hypothetical protein
MDGRKDGRTESKRDIKEVITAGGISRKGGRKEGSTDISY